MKKNNNRLDRIYKLSVIIPVAILALIYGKSILLPLVFSFFISLALYPLVSFLKKYVKNLALAIGITLLLVLLVVGGGIYLISSQFQSLISELPSLQDQFLGVINNIADYIEQNFHYTSKEQITYLRNGAQNLLKSSGSIFSGAVNTTSSIFTFLTLVPIYVFFILLYQDNFKLFFKRVTPADATENYLKVVTQVREVVQGYIGGMGVVILIIATLNCIGLFALGIEYALFFGIFSAVLTVIPYIGIAIGASLPTLFALVTKDSLAYPIGVMILYAVVQFLEGNFITPKIVGDKVNINPLAAIVALIIGGSIWGIIGMILAIPVTGILQILLYRSERTKSFALLLRAENDIPDQKDENIE
ncbi:AI-2E family transporter [bacterium]|nr:AI-2E family transporter [bacterium]